MQVSAGAVSPTVPEAQTEPGNCRKERGGELPAARSAPNPPQTRERNPPRVKHEEANVQHVIPSHRILPARILQGFASISGTRVLMITQRCPPQYRFFLLRWPALRV